MKRPHSATHNPRYLYINPQAKNFIPPEALPNLDNYPQMIKFIKEEGFEEEISLLQLSWNELGITPEYRQVFINLLREANEVEKNNIFNEEKNNIKKFKDSLLGLKKEIENRENNLSQLKKFNFSVQNVISNGDEANSLNQILQNTIAIIKTLRINAINIVKKLIKVNKIIAYYTTSGKFNIKQLKPEYSFDPKYLYKMKEDLKFLKNSALNTFIEMNNSNIDAFLTNCAPSSKGVKEKKIVIPLPDDVMKMIIQCRYELLQETVLDNIEKDSANNGIINTKSMDFFEMNSLLKHSKNNNLINKLEKEKFKLKLGLSNSSIRNRKQNEKFRNNFIHSTRGYNISRYLHNLKNSGKINYDNYFYIKRNNSPLVPKRRFFGNLRKNNNIINISNPSNNKIIIMHEEIESLKHDQFMKRLGSIQNLDNDEENKEQSKAIENQMLNENIDFLKDEILELKSKLKNWEIKVKNETEKRENFEIKNNELISKAKEYQSELEKISQNKKKKEKELNNKIESLSKELQDIKYERLKGDDDLIKQFKNLEDRLQNEENLRKNGEKIIENLEKNLKEEITEKERLYYEKSELEKNLFLNEENVKKISEGKLIFEEENQKLKEDIKNLEEAKREKEHLIKEKEEENQKIISDKNINENEKINALNELEKIKEEYEIMKTQFEKQKDEINELNNKILIFESKTKRPENIYQSLEPIIIPGKEKNSYIIQKNEEFKIFSNKKNDYENLVNYEINKPINKEGENKLISLDDQIKYNGIENEKENLKENNKAENNEIISDKKFNIQDDDNKNSTLNFNYINDNNHEITNLEGKNKNIENNIHENLINESNNNINDSELKKLYIVDYYRGNLFNLLAQLNEAIPLESIPDFIQRAFALDDSVFSESFYFKGIFPKIIISKSIKENNKITGMCSFYYESTEDLNENLILRINSIIVEQNYEEQIIEMINFIKNKVECDKIMVYILYDKIGEKFVTNSEAKDLFQNKLKFKWFCVVRDEKLNQRYIQYSFSKIEENYDPNKNETTLAVNALRHNKNNFLMNNIMITSINQELQSQFIKKNFSSKFGYTKFMNPNLIYFLLLDNKSITSDFFDESKLEELKQMMEKMEKYSSRESNYGKDIIGGVKHIDEEMENSIYNEIKIFLEHNSLTCVPNLFKTKLTLNFETNYSTVFENFYYNRISTDKISILEEEKSGAKFFLIPSKDNNTLLYISEVNQRLQELLIDGTKNVYEKFLEFQPSTQKQLFEFSVKSIRDISYIPLSPRNKFKTIYIPCFCIKTHLFSYDFREINKNVKIKESLTNIPLNVTSIDEFINVEFKPDNNIENSFSTIEGYDYIIQDSFIMGIFDNDIINNSKLPLLQFLYITKDNFLKKDDFNYDKKE